MWSEYFEDRLVQWHQLRHSGAALSEHDKLLSINDWWWRAPQVNHHLHWSDRDTWPDPWNLLAQDRWCDLARALGIAYTVIMMDRGIGARLRLVETNLANLVLVDSGKYILNWCPGQILNIASDELVVKRQISGDELSHQLGEK